MTNPSHTFASPFLQLQATPDESTVVAAMPSGREKTLVTSETNPVTGRIEFNNDSLYRPGGNVVRFRRVFDFFDGLDSTPLTAGVGVNGETSALNTAIGASGKTAFGYRAWRLTTAAVNNSYAEVTVDNENTSTGTWLRNIAQIDPALPLIIVIAPHATNGGSHLKLFLGAQDVSDAGNASLRGDMYIDGLSLSGEVVQPVVALQYDMRSLYSNSANSVETPALLRKMRIQAFQEGATGITDISILGVYQALERPMLHIGFDDGLQSVYDYAFPIMQERGLVGSVALMGNYVGNGPGDRRAYLNMPCMIKSEVDELIAAGWEITTHGTVVLNSLSTYAQVLAQVTSDKASVDALGDEYRKSSDFYVYPGGAGKWSTDVDGEPIGQKALASAGFKHGRLLFGNAKFISHALCGLGLGENYQSSLSVDLLRAPATTIYETGDYATQVKKFGLFMEKLAVGGFFEVLTHNVVPRSYFPSGKPYLPTYTGAVATNNDTSVETFTSMMDIVQQYRDLGLVDVVLKRDWYAGVPVSLAHRRSMSKHWTP